MNSLSFHHPDAAKADPSIWGETPLMFAKAAAQGLKVAHGIAFSQAWPKTLLGEFHPKATDGSPWPPEWQTALREALSTLETQCHHSFAHSSDAPIPQHPLWLHVCWAEPLGEHRLPSGVQNLGITPQQAAELALLHQSNDKKVFYVWDALRRMADSYGKQVLRVSPRAVVTVYDDVLKEQGVEDPNQLDTQRMETLAKRLCGLCAKLAGDSWCARPFNQLQLALETLWLAEQVPLAQQRRLQHQEAGQPEAYLHVYLQQALNKMAFHGGCGRMQWRTPSTGQQQLHGLWLEHAQVDDLTAGWLLPQTAACFEKTHPLAAETLRRYFRTLEPLLANALQVDFVFESTAAKEGPLVWLTNLRPAQRSEEGGFRMAMDLHTQGHIDAKRALVLTSPDLLIKRMHPVLQVQQAKALCKGLAASPGAAVGRLALFAEHAEEMAAQGEPVILMREETTPEDINGFHCAKGVVTVRGGFTSHAAVVARGLGMPCIVGASKLDINYHINTLQVGDSTLKRGDWISVDGTTGTLYPGQLPVVIPALGDELQAMLKLADEHRQLGVLANADTPQDARNAIAQGGEGIGLCRTEHMFFDLDRILAFRKMILASTLAERKNALLDILPMQRKDFEDIFEVMEGKPVTIRFLDPPLHEFLPEGLRSQHRLVSIMNVPLAQIQKRVEELHEQNPMMGRRGCRLAITNPEICIMQTRAILEAACNVKKRGGNPQPKLMIPLVSAVGELRWLRRSIETAAEAVFAEQNTRIAYEVGVMIETPRAALCATAFAHFSDFLSFGTNDLTQMVYGFSRDDTGGFLPRYLEEKVLEDNPFVHIDEQGVGQLLQMVMQKARSVNPKLQIGICGEHGGDPRSVMFFHRLGFDYVSCSPFRIMPARLAAGQAALTYSYAKE